jgi:lipopolysaccharide/colanic/teichoic acid biosynthesis glycosyltransferase
MSASVLDHAPAGDAGLADIYDHFVADESLPSPEWLTRLQLERPRRSTRCLGEATRAGKRLVDVIGATLLLLALWPVMLIVAALVRFTSPGPIIFRQVRVGLNLRESRDRRRLRERFSDGAERREPGRDRRDGPSFGKSFVLYKFRTMRVDAEKNGAQLAVKGDPRVTPIGRFLRRTRLDELPQLWNVLRGEMSLVGPRPERPEFCEKLSNEIPNYLNRLGLKPGLTGLAQIINGYDTDLDSVRRKVNFDLLYLQNCCVLNDIKILFRTVGVVLRGSGAH